MSNFIIPTFKMGFARSPGESRAPDLWRGLKGAWLPFLGPTGLELRDCSGYGNHGTLTNMEAATDWVIDGSYALNFDGADELVNCGSGTILDRVGIISIAVRFQFAGTPSGNDRLVSNGIDGTNYGYEILLGSGIKKVRWGDGAGFITTDADYNQDQWYDLVVTHDGTNAFAGLAIYMDGILQAVTDAGAFNGFSVTGRRFCIACSDNGAFITHAKVKVSSVSIWDRKLSHNEILNSYAMWELARRPQMKAPGDTVQLTATSAAVTATTATLTIGVTESMTATAAAVVSTTATLTKAGIVDMTATAAAVVSTTASLSKGERVNMTATAAAVTSTTASLTVGVTESMTATAAAVTSATGKLTFVGEKDFFLDIPIHTLSIDNSTQILKPFTNAIPIDHGLTIDNTTGVIKVETNAIPIPSLSSDAARVLPRTNPGAVLLYTGVYNDFTAEARDNTPDDVDLSQGAGTILYIGYKEKFYAVRIIVSTAGVGSYTMEAAKYWNGAAWVTLAYSDGELDDFKTAETIHIAGLPNDPDDWAKTTVNGSELYWISMETLSGTQSQKPLAQRISLQIVGVVASYRFITFSSEQVYQEFF